MASVLCPTCGKDPRKSLKEFNSGDSDLCNTCLASFRGRLKLRAKVSSVVGLSKKSENEISQYLFGTNRLWKEQEDIGNDKWRGEVKSYSWALIGQQGGIWSVLNAALEQCKQAISDKDIAIFAVLRVKGCGIEKSYCTIDGETLITLGTLKSLINPTQES